MFLRSRWPILNESFIDSGELPGQVPFIEEDETFNGNIDFNYINSDSYNAKEIVETLDLRSTNNKIFICPNAGMFHINLDAIIIIGSILINTNYSVIVDTLIIDRHNNDPGAKNISLYFHKVIEYFNRKFDNRIILFNSSKCYYYILDNYYILRDGFMSVSIYDAEKTFDYVRSLFNIKNSIGTKKVYLSRKNFADRAPIKKSEILNPNFSKNTSDIRMLDEYILELFFRENGFEIVYPEDFETIDDQINYFSQSKILVSVTSSGLGNMIFMPKNSSILELTTSFMALSEESDSTGYSGRRVVEVLHNQYGPLSHILGHAYAKIPNYSRYPKDIIDYIMNNKSVYNFLELGESND